MSGHFLPATSAAYKPWFGKRVPPLPGLANVHHHPVTTLPGSRTRARRAGLPFYPLPLTLVIDLLCHCPNLPRQATVQVLLERLKGAAHILGDDSRELC
jgi:hypothetical protein